MRFKIIYEIKGIRAHGVEEDAVGLWGTGARAPSDAFGRPRGNLPPGPAGEGRPRNQCDSIPTAPKRRDMTSVREGSAGPPVGPSRRKPRSSPAPLPLPAPPLVTAGPEGWRPAPLHVGVTCAMQHDSRAPGHTPPTFLESTARMDRARPSACGADGRTGRHAVSSPRPRAERRGQCGSRAHPPRFPGVSGGGRAVDGRERGRAGRADGARPAGWPWAVAEPLLSRPVALRT